jgi:hypothetical protein
LTLKLRLPVDGIRPLLDAEHWEFAKDHSGVKYARTASLWLHRQGVPLGLPLVRVDSLVGRQNFASMSLLQEAINQAPANVLGRDPFGNAPGHVVFEFELGIDMRSCWGDLEDFDGRGVCNEEVLQDLLSKVEQMEQPEYDGAGQSGSTIITNLPNHLIKSSSEEEYGLMQEVMPKFSKAIEERQEKFGGCWSTGLAPICAALIEPLKPGEVRKGKASTIWLHMREIALPRDYSPIKGVKTSWFDLKGPAFKGWSDGKSKVSREFPFIGKHDCRSSGAHSYLNVFRNLLENDPDREALCESDPVQCG